MMQVLAAGISLADTKERYNMTKRHSRNRIFGTEDFPIIAYIFSGNSAKAPSIHLHHPEIEIQFISQGHCEYFVKDSIYKLKKNSILIIPKNEIHNLILDSKSYIKKFSLVFSPKLFVDDLHIIELINHFHTVQHFTLPDKAAAITEFTIRGIADECVCHNGYWKNIVKNNVEILLMQLRRASEVIPPEPSQHDPNMLKVIAYLQENFSEPISLQDVANHFNISYYYLSRIFKQNVGMGFRDYLIHIRIMEAKKLLEETDWKIITIAAMVGFNDVTTFYRDFQQLTGSSPALYRKISK